MCLWWMHQCDFPDFRCHTKKYGRKWWENDEGQKHWQKANARNELIYLCTGRIWPLSVFWYQILVLQFSPTLHHSLVFRHYTFHWFARGKKAICWPQFFNKAYSLFEQFLSSQKRKRGHLQQADAYPSEMMGSTHGCEEVNLDRRALSSLKIFVLWSHWLESVLGSLQGGERASKCASKPFFTRKRANIAIHFALHTS